jgi:hypothetical protein
MDFNCCRHGSGAAFGKLLGNNDGAQIVFSRPAVFFRVADSKETKLSQSGKNIAGKIAGLVPFIHIWRYFFGYKFPHCFPYCLVHFVKYKVSQS